MTGGRTTTLSSGSFGLFVSHGARTQGITRETADRKAMIDAGLDQIDSGFVFYVDDLNVATYNRPVLETTELLIDGNLRRLSLRHFFG